ncbi:S-methylmethionine permease [Klebsiella pneumoniae IS53]|nr:S-methylmethionine permease [Klebsiella pneumoniae IS53]
MLSLGGVIGTGLFFNTGYIISTTGAAGTLLAYLIGALVVWLVMQCLGELSVAMPETRRLPRFTRRAILARRRAIPWRGSTG